jgi:hypothetical protein
MVATGLLPGWLNDFLFPPILDFALGKPSKHGITRPKQGLLRQIANAGKIPVIDVGTLKKISEGKIHIAPGIEEFWEDGVVFKDGNRKRFDAIILATGYRPNYQSFLKFSGAREEARELGLFFVGYHNVVTGLLREISKESVRIAEHISGRLARGG